jgi:hypothetical protein
MPNLAQHLRWGLGLVTIHVLSDYSCQTDYSWHVVSSWKAVAGLSAQTATIRGPLVANEGHEGQGSPRWATGLPPVSPQCNPSFTPGSPPGDIFSYPPVCHQGPSNSATGGPPVGHSFLLPGQWIRTFIPSYHLHPEIPMGQQRHSIMPPASWDTNG